MSLYERGPNKESKERIYLKTLSLITPEMAHELGIPAEAPVFISPVQNFSVVCDFCRRSYGPLVYQVGRVVEAHHFHKDERGSGGIFFTQWDTDNFPSDYIVTWQAILTPISKRTVSIPSVPTITRRSKAVLIERITAFCTTIYGGFPTKHRKEISEGPLYSFTKSRFLSPLCSLEEHPEVLPFLSPWCFKIINGEVFFTKT